MLQEHTTSRQSRVPEMPHEHTSRQLGTLEMLQEHTTSRQSGTPEMLHEHTSRQSGTPEMLHEHTSRQSGTPEMLHEVWTHSIKTVRNTRNAVLKNTKCHHKCCTQEHQASPQMLYTRTPRQSETPHVLEEHQIPRQSGMPARRIRLVLFCVAWSTAAANRSADNKQVSKGLHNGGLWLWVALGVSWFIINSKSFKIYIYSYVYIMIATVIRLGLEDKLWGCWARFICITKCLSLVYMPGSCGKPQQSHQWHDACGMVHSCGMSPTSSPAITSISIHCISGIRYTHLKN